MLLQYGRHSGTLCGFEQRSAGVSADAYGHIGPKIAYQSAAAACSLPGQPQHAEVAPQTSTVESGDGQSFDGVTGRRHTFHFHTSVGAHEAYFGIGVATAYLVGYGQRREDVSAGAAAADDDAVQQFPAFVAVFSGSFGCFHIWLHDLFRKCMVPTVPLGCRQIPYPRAW